MPFLSKLPKKNRFLRTLDRPLKIPPSSFTLPLCKRSLCKRERRAAKWLRKATLELFALQSLFGRWSKQQQVLLQMSLWPHLPSPLPSTHLPSSHRSLWMRPSAMEVLQFAMKPSLLICSKLRSSWFNSLLSGELMRSIKYVKTIMLMCQHLH